MRKASPTAAPSSQARRTSPASRPQTAALFWAWPLGQALPGAVSGARGTTGGPGRGSATTPLSPSLRYCEAKKTTPMRSPSVRFTHQYRIGTSTSRKSSEPRKVQNEKKAVSTGSRSPCNQSKRSMHRASQPEGGPRAAPNRGQYREPGRTLSSPGGWHRRARTAATAGPSSAHLPGSRTG